jgi:hypothetical protein
MATPPQAAESLIPESRAREVRGRAFGAADQLLAVVEKQIERLKTISDAEMSLEDVLEKEGISGLQKQMERIPALIEMAKEISAPLKNVTGLVMIQGPLPGEAKYVPHHPGECREPPTVENLGREVILKAFSVGEKPEGKRKPKKRRTG